MADDRNDLRERDETEGDPDAIELWLRPFVTDSTLWPVLFVAVGAFVSMGVGLISLVWTDRNPFAAVALLAVVLLSIDVAWRQRGEGGSRLLVGLLGALWGLTGLTAAIFAFKGWI